MPWILSVMSLACDTSRSTAGSGRSAPSWGRGTGMALGLTLLVTTACSSPSRAPNLDDSRFADLAAPSAEELTDTLMGWSAAEVPDVDQEVIGTWMARNTWENLAAGQWLADNPGYVAFVEQHPQAAADIGVPLVPHDSGQPLDGLLTEVVNGDRDQVFRSMGAALATGGPATVYARLWWEMNLRPMADGIDPELFRQAWVRAAPLIREGFVGRARPGQTLQVVFSPNADGADYEQFYPGDDVVDLMALDAYGQRWGSDTPSEAGLLTLLNQQLTQFADFAREHGKPVAMAEWGNVAVKAGQPGDQMQGRGDFPPYVALVLDWAAREDAEYLVYFNSDEGGVGQTLADTPDSLTMLQRAWSVG